MSQLISSNLQHRCSKLYLTSGILWSESIHRADVSDFFGLTPPPKDCPEHQMWLMRMQIAVGKTTNCKNQWGRATRHKNVKLCCCGAVSFYMQYRVFVTREFQNMSVADWLNNQTWFDIKFLVDVYGSDKTKEMSHDPFATHIKKVLSELELPVNKRFIWVVMLAPRLWTSWKLHQRRFK